MLLRYLANTKGNMMAKEVKTEVYILTYGKHRDKKGRIFVEGDAVELTKQQAIAFKDKITLASEVEKSSDKPKKSNANKTKSPKSESTKTETVNTETEQQDSETTDTSDVANNDAPDLKKLGIKIKGARFYVGKKYFTKQEKAIEYVQSQTNQS